MPDLPISTSIVLLALGIGAAHMLAPDHWVPLTVYCHTKRMGRKRSALIATAGGLAHVAGSVVVMAAALVIGFALVSSFSQLTKYAIAASFVSIALYLAFVGRRAPSTEEGRVDLSRGTKWMILATASSPELTIFPIYLSATVLGSAEVVESISAFTVGTVISVVLATLAGLRGLGMFLRAPGREKQIYYAIALVMAVLAVFVLAGG